MAKPNLREVCEFLCGEKPLDGIWFHERPIDRPTFWWRPKLRAALVASEAEVERLQEALRQIAEAHHMMIEPDLKAVARAALTGEKP